MEKKQVHCFNGQTGKYCKSFNSLSEAAEKLNTFAGNIVRSIKSKSKAVGYYWSYDKVDNYLIKNKDHFQVKSQTTGQYDKDLLDLVDKLKKQYEPSELQALINGYRIAPEKLRAPKINFTGGHIKIGVIGDTHIGSLYTDDDMILQAFDIFKTHNVDMMVHTGDVTEGMSNRPGHIYELKYLGYDMQKDKAIELLKKCPVPAYYIDGNHDRWFMKSNGANIVKDICDAIPNATYLGHDEGDLSLTEDITLRLWHGEDGSSYATSYRIQKIIESLTGGDKPSILLLGHVHKQVYLFERNIHCVSTGCLQRQTPWMRGKRISAHTGFHIIDVYVGYTGVSRFGVEWFPFYV